MIHHLALSWLLILSIVFVSSSDDDYNPDTLYFFQVIQPQKLRYSYTIRRARDFGTDFKTILHAVPIVLAQPFHCCSRLRNEDEAKKSVVLCGRGECSFLSKTIQAELAGAYATIISSNDETDEGMIEMIKDETNRAAGIPAVYLAGIHGYQIRNYLMYDYSPVLIDIPINLTMTPLHEARFPPWELI